MQEPTYINIYQVFQEYPVFYQPYIPPVIAALRKQKHTHLSLQVFREGKGAGVEVLPSYYKRRFYERFCQKIKPQVVPLNYLELKAIKKDVDVLHVMDSFLFPKVLGLLALAKAQRPKVVITLRGNDTYIKPWLQCKWVSFYRDYGNAVDAYVVMSQHQKDYLHDKWGISSERIHVIPISLAISEDIEPKRIEGTTLRLVSAFRLCWEKNIEGNLRVVKELVSKGVPVKYALYGDGPDAGQVYYLIDRYGLSDVVTYHGKVSNGVLKAALRQSDMFLQLSCSESLGMSVLEAQSLGLPAIVSDAGGLPEAIVPGKSGFCVPSYDAEQAAARIVSLFEDPEAYTAFSKAGMAHVRAHFSIEHEVARLSELYTELTTRI